MSRERWLQSTRGVPVLMYHAFSDREEGDRYVLSRRSFTRQLRLLAALRLPSHSLRGAGANAAGGEAAAADARSC